MTILQLIITEVATGFDPADFKREMKVKNVQKRSKVIGREVTWLHRLCLGDVVGLSGHVSGAVVTMTTPCPLYTIQTMPPHCLGYRSR